MTEDHSIVAGLNEISLVSLVGFHRYMDSISCLMTLYVKQVVMKSLGSHPFSDESFFDVIGKFAPITQT